MVTTPASVSVQVEDSDGDASNTDSITVTISNVAPTVTIAGAEDVVEGSTHTYTFTVTDPGVDGFTLMPATPTVVSTVSSWPVRWWSPLRVAASPARSPMVTPQTTLIIKVTDDDGDSDVQSTDVHVVEIANVAPVVTLVGGQRVER